MLRLILVLLLAFASAPMPAAACHGGMSMAGPHAMAGMDHKVPAPMPVQHQCVGCVPVLDWDGARIVPPVAVTTPVLAGRIAAMPLLPGDAPVPPPPRVA